MTATWINPPSQVVALRTVLATTAAFVAGGWVAADVVHYPYSEAAPAPIAFVVEFDGRRSMRLHITAVPATLDVGQLQTLAQTLADQLPSVYRQAADGLLIAQDPEVSDVHLPTVGMVAGDDDLNEISLTLTIGLQRG